MKHLATVTFAAMLAVSPAIAEDTPEEGFSLMEEGAKILLRNLLEEMEPAIADLQEELGGLVIEMAPALEELRGLLGDMTQYHLPEVLPNGDIIIRRKSPLEFDPDAEIEI